MILPLQITCRNISLLHTIESAVEERASKLSSTFKNIMRCHVEVKMSEPDPVDKKTYLMIINIQIPGRQFAVKYSLALDPLPTIKKAFTAVQRLLQQYYQQLKHQHNASIEPPARVSELALDKGFGYITTTAGKRYYFDEYHVMGDGFKSLCPGVPVRFMVQSDGQEPQVCFLAPL